MSAAQYLSFSLFACHIACLSVCLYARHSICRSLRLCLPACDTPACTSVSVSDGISAVCHCSGETDTLVMSVSESVAVSVAETDQQRMHLYSLIAAAWHSGEHPTLSVLLAERAAHVSGGQLEARQGECAP